MQLDPDKMFIYISHASHHWTLTLHLSKMLWSWREQQKRWLLTSSICINLLNMHLA